ncbi:MAG: CHC2 zinc finger domain-containing protein, partial [Bradymonadaceae bacterium]
MNQDLTPLALIDTTDVAQALGLQKARERHKWACPFCGSSDGLHVYKESGQGAFCFVCDHAYDAIDLTRQALGLGFRDAVKWLAARYGVSDPFEGSIDLEEMRARRKEIDAERERRRVEKELEEAARRSAARDVFDRIWPELELTSSGLSYLEARSLNPEIAHHAGIRSVESRQEWDALLEGFWPDELEAAGLEGRNDRGTFSVPWFFPFLVIPYWLEEGGLDILRFRDLSGRANQKYLSPLKHHPQTAYLSHGAFDLADDYPTLYICEGELNALSIIIAGAPAIGSCGNGVWKPEWSKELRWFSRAVIFRDPDEPGERFAQKVRSVTADVLGLGERMGSLDAGKRADVLVTDGDPLQPLTRIETMFVGGV